MKLSDEHFEQLTAYLDGELKEHERREVEALIARDPQAAALLESLRQVSNAVAALPREAAPTGLSAAVQERLARRSLLDEKPAASQELPRLVIWTNRMAIAACLALVCTAGWLGIRSSDVRAPAIAFNEKRSEPVKTEGFVKESVNDKLAFTPPPPPNPLTPPEPASEPHRELAAPADLRSMVTYRDAGELEKKLNKSGASNRDIQQADLSSISNQLVIETDDPETRDEIVRVVENFARKKGIPDVNEKRLPEPVQATQTFFVVAPPQTRQIKMAKTDETWIGVNARMKEAHELMDCVSKVQARKKVPMQVELNSCRVESPNQGMQILELNTVYNQKRLAQQNELPDSEPVADAPVPAAPLADASTGRSMNDSEYAVDDGGRDKRETATPPAGERPRGASSPATVGSAAAKKVEAKPKEEPTEAEARHDNDEAAMKQGFQAGRAGGAPARGGIAKDVRAGDDKKEESPPPRPAAMTAPPPAEGCVTLSICVRNPSTQNAVLGAPTATQASDTIRPSGATSMPQTSMPAAGATRE